MNTRTILILAIVVALAALGIQNAGSVEVRFLFWTANVSLTLILLAVFILGAVTGSCLIRKPGASAASKGLVRDVDNE